MPAKEVDDVERIGLPMFVLVLMFMTVMTGAMHLLNAIIEEKMSKISEVLLGSRDAGPAAVRQAAGRRRRVAAADARLSRRRHLRARVVRPAGSDRSRC